MQFTWKYIDDLMGKGLGAGIITELLFYVSAGLIPLALPLAILLSSIMTFGNLAENNELTALKSSGLSLFRIMRPLTVVVFFIALATFYFANYVIPVANLKWHTLIFSIQETKVAALVTPGSYSTEIDGYAIKVEKGENNSFTGITIHDYTDPAIVKTIKADSGTIYKSTNGAYLLFRLHKGKVSEELNAQPPVFQPDGKPHHPGGDFRPGRRTRFEVATYKMDLSGFELQKNDPNMFKDAYEMLNVFQISDARDSMQLLADKSYQGFNTSLKNSHPYFLSAHFLDTGKIPDSPVFMKKIPTAAFSIDTISDAQRIESINRAISNLRRKNQDLDAQRQYLEGLQNSNDQFSIEFHKKFALTVTIIVLFFVGAPLGAIVRRGGFGAPVVIAALLFMAYFVLFSIGESLADSGVASPFVGMWMPTLILTPVAAVLMLSAANDLRVSDKKLWRLIFSLGRKR